MRLTTKTALFLGLAMAAMPAAAQHDEHHMMLDRLAQCHQVDGDAIAHITAMARGGRMSASDMREHRRILERLAWCRDSMTAIATHMEGMARMGH